MSILDPIQKSVETFHNDCVDEFAKWETYSDFNYEDINEQITKMTHYINLGNQSLYKNKRMEASFETNSRQNWKWQQRYKK